VLFARHEDFMAILRANSPDAAKPSINFTKRLKEILPNKVYKKH